MIVFVCLLTVNISIYKILHSTKVFNVNNDCICMCMFIDCKYKHLEHHT